MSFDACATRAQPHFTYTMTRMKIHFMFLARNSSSKIAFVASLLTAPLLLHYLSLYNANLLAYLSENNRYKDVTVNGKCAHAKCHQ